MWTLTRASSWPLLLDQWWLRGTALTWYAGGTGFESTYRRAPTGFFKWVLFLQCSSHFCACFCLPSTEMCLFAYVHPTNLLKSLFIHCSAIKCKVMGCTYGGCTAIGTCNPFCCNAIKALKERKCADAVLFNILCCKYYWGSCCKINTLFWLEWFPNIVCKRMWGTYLPHKKRITGMWQLQSHSSGHTLQ